MLVGLFIDADGLLRNLDAVLHPTIERPLQKKKTHGKSECNEREKKERLEHDIPFEKLEPVLGVLALDLVVGDQVSASFPKTGVLYVQEPDARSVDSPLLDEAIEAVQTKCFLE